MQCVNRVGHPLLLACLVLATPSQSGLLAQDILRAMIEQVQRSPGHDVVVRLVCAGAADFRSHKRGFSLLSIRASRAPLTGRACPVGGIDP